jgi:hypothetical protein
VKARFLYVRQMRDEQTEVHGSSPKQGFSLEGKPAERSPPHAVRDERGLLASLGKGKSGATYKATNGMNGTTRATVTVWHCGSFVAFERASSTARRIDQLAGREREQSRVVARDVIRLDVSHPCV